MKSLLLIPALALAALPAQADVLLSNLAQPQRAVSPLNAQFWAAQSFTNDSSAHALQSVDALLSLSMHNPGTEFVAELHAEGGVSGIGAELTRFDFASDPTQAPTAIRLLPQQAVTLLPGQTYWLVVGEHFSSDDHEYLGWTYAEGNASTGAGHFGAFGFSTDGGASWSASSFDTPNPFQMAVNVSAVPEPAAWLLMPAGLALLALRRRRAA